MQTRLWRVSALSIDVFDIVVAESFEVFLPHSITDASRKNAFSLVCGAFKLLIGSLDVSATVVIDTDDDET